MRWVSDNVFQTFALSYRLLRMSERLLLFKAFLWLVEVFVDFVVTHQLLGFVEVLVVH